jgi:hypothetical protein
VITSKTTSFDKVFFKFFCVLELEIIFCSRGSRFVEIFRHGKKQKINRDFPIKTCGHRSSDKPLFAALRHLNLKKFVSLTPYVANALTNHKKAVRVLEVFLTSFVMTHQIM